MAGAAEHPTLGPGLRALRRSLYAQQVLTSVVYEWEAIPEMATHTRATEFRLRVVDASVFRDMAIGHCIRLHFLPDCNQADKERLMTSLVCAIYEARRTDQAATAILREWPTDDALSGPWLQLIWFWHKQRMYWLRQAAKALRKVTPSAQWLAGRTRARANVSG